MEEFDCVTFKGKYGRFKKGDDAVILDISGDRCCLEVFDKNGNTIDVIMGVPLSCLKVTIPLKEMGKDKEKICKK